VSESAWNIQQGKWPNKSAAAATNIPASHPKFAKDIFALYEQSPWKLGKLNLTQQAADYYLLAWVQADMEIIGDLAPGKLWPPFAKKLGYLAGQFSRYTDMAVGGELRHARSKVSWDNIPKPIQEGLATAKLPSSRKAAWHGWYFMRQQYGTIALRWAMMTFQKFKGGGFGGLKWSVIAETLWKYEKGVYSGQTFVDTAWGLEHNNGCYFNKKWQPGILKVVLDANQKGDYAVLWEKASTAVKKHLMKQDKGVW
jgi:hypothetical protein